MTLSFSGPLPAGYCLKCHTGYAVGPHVCAPEKMRIEWERPGGSLWHADCDATRSGVIKELSREPGRTLMQCLNCGRQAYFPVGGVSECVPVVGRVAVEAAKPC